MVELGGTVKDKISKFEGVATGRLEYLFGCVRWQVTPRTLKKDGEPTEAQWFDEEQLVPIKSKKKIERGELPAAGPRCDPPGR